MSQQQSSTSSETPVEQKLCKMGCGFFGNATTGDCCSKCWRSMKKDDVPAAVVQPPAPVQCRPVVTEEPTPMEVDTPAPAEEEPPKEEKPAPKPTTTAPKKKKKASYKNMMKGMMHSNSPQKAQKEKDALRKVTGGGAFSKIDKI